RVPSGEDHSQGVVVALDGRRIMSFSGICGRLPTQGSVRSRSERARKGVDVGVHLWPFVGIAKEKLACPHVSARQEWQELLEFLAVIPEKPGARGNDCPE